MPAGETYVMGLFGFQKCRTQPFDNIYTPDDTAKLIVDRYKPSGKVLEPCAGEGAFLKVLPKDTEWCEIEKGRNFFEYKQKVDWIVTNPPFSKLRKFLIHSMEISQNVVFLINLPGLFTVAIMKAIYVHKFGIKEILLLRQPTTFPQTGRQSAAVFLKKGYSGHVNIIYDNDLKEFYKIKPGKMKWPVQIKKRKSTV